MDMCLSNKYRNKCNDHFLLKCLLFRNQRAELMNGITTELDVLENSISAELLLYGSNDHNDEYNRRLFKHVHQYLTSTKRF